jgi:DNA-binding protein H-NS
MSKASLAKIQAQIEKLQKQAEAIRAREVNEVIARIKVALDHYGISAADLGLDGRAAKAGRASKAAPVAKRGRKAAAPRKASVIKYRDEAGHTWTGHGKRPGWFKAAIAGGKRLEDLLVTPQP